MSKLFGKYTISGGMLLITALMGANFLNFVFNAFLGRVLSLEEYGALTLINTLWFLLSIFINSLATTTNHYAAFHSGKENKGYVFYQAITKNSFKASLLITTIWLAITPFLVKLFNLPDWYTLLSITPVISLGTLLAVSRGYLQGKFMFGTVALLIVVEAISKLIYAFLFVQLNFYSIAYLSIPLSILTAFIVTYILSPNKEVKHIPKQTTQIQFPIKFYFSTLITGIGSAAFLSIDILLAKHYLSASDAGVYALLSLVGKMIYFFGSLFNSLVITYVSRELGSMKDVKSTFYKMFMYAVGLTSIAYIALGYYGDFFVPLLLGNKAFTILPYIQVYGMGIAIFTISSTVVSFHLSNKRFLLSYVGLFSTAVMALGMVLFHRSILEMVYVLFVASVLNFSVVMLLHMYFLHWKKVRISKTTPPPILAEYKKKLPIAVSICVPAYNEENTIGKLLDGLLAQKTKTIAINKIVIVSSASTDNTNKIVRDFTKRDSRVILITENERNGKAAAINKGIKQTNDDIVVIQSADTFPHEDTIEKLCRPFLTDRKIGMTGGAPIPLNNKNAFIGYIVHTWWWFHRHIPRFGEIIAYRNILDHISSKTAVDEAYIQAKFVQMGYDVVLVDEAVVYNKGAETFTDMIKQRRRIHNGHSRLVHDESIRVSSLSKSTLWLLLFKYEINNVKEFVWLVGGMGIECLAVFLAQWDKYVGNKNPIVWDIARSTKKLDKRQKRALREALN